MEPLNVVTLFGGIALFLFGMSVMGDSLKKVAGNKLEVILYKLSGNTLKGILLGTGVTAVIQSSSATSVMVVGFVNSGMMQVRQAIGIVLGAILGTSVTGWILCLNSLSSSGSSIASFLNTEILTGMVALIGIILWMAAKKSSHKNIGGIMLGFAVLMYGMSMMSGALAPLKENESFINLLTSFSNPIIGVVVGLLVTALLQSASAAIGILQALAMSGSITFSVAFPIIMGIAIGASVPVLLSALGASANGKRTAFVYLLIDVLGAVICGAVFYALNAVMHFGFMGSIMTMVSIAFVNTLFRLVTVIVLSPFTGVLEKLVCKLFPDSPEAVAEKADMDRLEPRFLTNPALSLEQSRLVIDSMARKTEESIMNAVAVRQNYNREGVKRVNELEGVIDRYEDKLGIYLAKASKVPLTTEQTTLMSKYLKVLTDFERMSDHAKNIGEASTEMAEKKIKPSGGAEKDLRVIEAAIIEITELAIKAFVDNDKETALRVDPLEEVIDRLCDTAKSNHTIRVSRQECTIENGFVFNDLLANYERISDHASNIAIDVIETNEYMGAHEYTKIEALRNESFMEFVDEYSRKYAL